MLVHPGWDPIALQIGPLAVRWYGLSYLAGFMTGLAIGLWRTRLPHHNWKKDDIHDMLFYIVIGVLIGGRFGYVFFYHMDLFLDNPLYLFKVWEGGMSFHGGLLGVMAALFVFARKLNKNWFEVTDTMTCLAPWGLMWGRIGNFINGELWGSPSTLPWAMVFPDSRAGDVARHPSQLYEALGEGLILGLILLWFGMKPRPQMAMSGLFLFGYGTIRFAIEFIRIPDEHLGYLALDWLTMGQILSTPMIVFGAALLFFAYRRKPA